MSWELVHSLCISGLITCGIAFTVLLFLGDRQALEALGLIRRPERGRPAPHILLRPHHRVPGGEPALRSHGHICRECGTLVTSDHFYSRTTQSCATCVGARVIAGGRRGGRPRKGVTPC